MDLTISSSPLSYTEFKNFITSSANWFAPSLQEMPHLDEWISKMYRNGKIYYFKSENDIVSLTVTYENLKEHFIYIPYICVHPRLQGQGVGGQIINYIVKNLSDNIHNIYLEVRKDNIQAIQLYKKIGFYESEDRGEKYLLKKEL